MTRTWVRLLAVVLIAAGLYAVFNPKVILPTDLSWSGDFWASDWGMLAKALRTTGHIAFAAGLQLLIVSFTNLVSKD